MREIERDEKIKYMEFEMEVMRDENKLGLKREDTIKQQRELLQIEILKQRLILALAFLILIASMIYRTNYFIL